MTTDLPATSVVSFNLGEDLDAFTGLAEDVANVQHVLWTANERREHDVDLQRSVHHRSSLRLCPRSRGSQGQGSRVKVRFTGSRPTMGWFGGVVVSVSDS